MKINELVTEVRRNPIDQLPMGVGGGGSGGGGAAKLAAGAAGAAVGAGGPAFIDLTSKLGDTPTTPAAQRTVPAAQPAAAQRTEKTTGPAQGRIGAELQQTSGGEFRSRADRLDQAKVNAVLGTDKYKAGSAEANMALANYYRQQANSSGPALGAVAGSPPNLRIGAAAQVPPGANPAVRSAAISRDAKAHLDQIQSDDARRQEIADRILSQSLARARSQDDAEKTTTGIWGGNSVGRTDVPPAASQPVTVPEGKNSSKRIQEIQRTPDDREGYSTANAVIKSSDLKGLKMIPGSNRLGYTFGTTVSLFTGATNIIQLYDLKHPSKGRYRIGWLALRKSSLPFPKAFDVANVNIDEQYRGQGLGQTMYGIAMKLLGITIVADETQTNAARRMWVYLSKIPGVEINGYTTIWADNWDKRATPDEIDDYDDLRLIKALIRGGGKEFGRKHNSVYVSFPVTGNVNQSELRAINNGLAIYSAQHPEFGGTQNGLYARWVGI